MDKQEKDEVWQCPYCGLGFPCPCAMDAEDDRLAAMDHDYFDEEEMTGYEELDELYEGVPKFQKIQRSQSPVSDGHNLQRVTENARNRQLKAARKTKDLLRERVE